VFRELATVELSNDSDVISDVGKSASSYQQTLMDLAKGSFGAFRPTSVVDDWTSYDKVREDVYLSTAARGRHSDPIIVSFCLGDFVYGGVFTGGWIDADFVSFVNRAIKHSGGDRYFACFPTGRQAEDGVPALASEDVSTLRFAHVSERVLEEAYRLGILPFEDDGHDLPKAALPSGSIAAKTA
jgi:hypothetical protein